MGDGRSISTEGKIGIFLALIGLLGAGAIMIAPQQLWIGWSLIAIAVIGLIILGFYHFWGRIHTPAGQATIGAVAIAVILSAEYGYYTGYFENGLPSFGPSVTPQSQGPTLPPGLPIQSRLERFIFTCDVPPPTNDQEVAEQKARLQKNIRVWGDSLGVNISFVDLNDGIQAIAEAKTPEAKARFLSMGIAYGITKLMAEARRSGKQQIIVVRAEIPKNTPMILGLVPDPNDPHLAEGRKLLAQFLEVPESACRMI
jgi:hypothetical protein